MKIILTFALSLIFVGGVCAQNLSVEKNFEKNRNTFSLTRFSFGEDASSGWDYLVYHKKTSTKKIRSIWTNYTHIPKVEDYYFEAGKPLLLVIYTGKKSQYKSLAKGANLPLKVVEKFYFTDSKMVSWIENGKNIPTTDSRWAEKEKELLAGFEDQLETYRSHLRGEL